MWCIWILREVSASRMSVHAVAWLGKLRAVAGRAPHAGPGPLGSGVGIAMMLLIWCAKSHLYHCVCWGRCCIWSNASWSGTAEEVESVCRHQCEKKVPVEAVFEGTWRQGNPLTVARCLFPFWCLLPTPCQRLGVSVSSWCPGPGPAQWLPSTQEKGPGPSYPSWDIRRWLGKNKALPEPLPAAGWGRKDKWCIAGIIYTVTGNPGLYLCRAVLWPAVYRWLYRNTAGSHAQSQRSLPVRARVINICV